MLLWAKWLIVALIATRYKPYQFSGDSKSLAGEMRRLAVVIPVLNEEPATFREVLERVLAELPGRLVVIINGPRDPGLEEVCEKFNADWIFTPRPGKRHAVKLGVDWIQENCPENKYIALIDSDTLIMPGGLSELVKAFLADETVGGVCGTQKIHRADQSRLAWFSNWLEDYYQANYWRAFSCLGQIGCLWGRCAVYRREVIVESMKHFLNQRILGTRIESADDRYLTFVALHMGYKTVFQSTSIIYTAAQESFRNFAKQQLRWHRGDQASNLAQLGWLWRKKIPLASLFTTDFLHPFFFVAVLVNAFANMVNGRAVLAAFLVIAFLFFALTNMFHFRLHRRDLLTLPVFIIMVAFLILPIQAWGLTTCTFDKGWLTREGSYTVSGNEQARWMFFLPSLLTIILTIASVFFGYLTSRL